MSLFFSGTRIPNFRDVASRLDYNNYWHGRGFVLNNKLKEREEIILAHIPKGASVLDIGCGNSLLPVALQKKGCEVAVGDIAEIVLKGYETYSIKTLPIDLENLSVVHFPEQYDYIILSEVLEHTKNPEEIVRFLAAYTKKFAITIPNSAFYRYRIHLFFTGRFFTQWVIHPSEHIRFWSHTDFLDWLGAMGLDVESSVASNGFSFFGLFPQCKNIWKNLFGHQIVYFVQSMGTQYKKIY